MDLLLVHPPRAEKHASELRRRLVVGVAALGLVADVTVLSTQELLSSGFWESEHVVDLGALVNACATRRDG